MEKSISDLKKIAKRQLSGTGFSNIALTLITIGGPIISYIIFRTYSLIALAILLAPVLLGVWIYFLKLVMTYKVPYKRNPDTDYVRIGPGYVEYSTSNPNALTLDASTILYGFKYFFAATGLLIWYLIWVFSWSCLLVIPGIMKFYSYRLCFIILADNPKIGIRKSLKLSEKMMIGHRLKLFLLDISFIGWIIASLFTFLLATVVSFPYIMATNAVFYKELKQYCISNKIIEEDDIISKNSWDL